MDFCSDPFCEIFFWYYGIWRRQKKDMSKTLEQTSATDTILHNFFFLLTLSYDSRWKLCNLSGTCMRHRPKPTENGRGSGQLLSSTRCTCNSLLQHWELEKRGQNRILVNYSCQGTHFCFNSVILYKWNHCNHFLTQLLYGYDAVSLTKPKSTKTLYTKRSP